MMTVGAEEMMLGVEGLAIGSRVVAMATGSGPVPETVSDSVPAPDVQAPLMGHDSLAEHRFFPLIHACSPQVLSTENSLLGTTCYL